MCNILFNARLRSARIIQCNANIKLQRPPKKLIKNEHTTPVLYGTVLSRKGTGQQTFIKILLDSGTSSSIVCGSFTKKLRMKQRVSNTWSTKGGTFNTNYVAKCQITLPEMDKNKLITWDCHVDDRTVNSRYDMIMGRDLLRELKFNLDFDDDVVSCR